MSTALDNNDMPKNLWKAATDNNPNIIATLVADTYRAGTVWADPHNAPFYLHPLSQAVDGRPRKVVVSSVDGIFKQLAPDANDPCLIKASEPALQVTFSRKPKHPELGYLIGSDRSLCDIFLGSADDRIGQFMFTMSFNHYNEVIMTSLSENDILISYGKQTAKRRNFNWVFPPGQETIFVTASEAIKFTVEVPAHVTDQASYETNCRNFKRLANSASEILNLPNLSSQSLAGPASEVTTSQVPAERPFYLRTRKLGSGGFGVVHKARSMPDGRIVAVKRFKSKIAWKLEARIFRKIAKTPHVSTAPRHFRKLLTHGPAKYHPIHRSWASRQAVLGYGVRCWRGSGRSKQI